MTANYGWVRSLIPGAPEWIMDAMVAELDRVDAQHAREMRVLRDAIDAHLITWDVSSPDLESERDVLRVEALNTFMSEHKDKVNGAYDVGLRDAKDIENALKSAILDLAVGAGISLDTQPDAVTNTWSWIVDTAVDKLARAQTRVAELLGAADVLFDEAERLGYGLADAGRAAPVRGIVEAARCLGNAVERANDASFAQAITSRAEAPESEWAGDNAVLRTRVFDLEKQRDHWRRRYEQVLGVVTWMSGAADFAPGGQACEYFQRVVLPSITSLEIDGRTTPDHVAATVAGALFDFAGALTTRDAQLVVSARHEPGPLLDALNAWAEARGLRLTDANVANWNRGLS